MSQTLDLISPTEVSSLAALFAERVRRTPDAVAYRRFARDGQCCPGTTWQEVATLAGRWQQALRNDGLQAGDRVAVMLRNCLEWVAFDLAALGLGLVTVPLFVNDRPENFAFIIEETAARFLFIDGVAQWQRITEVHQRLATLVRIVSVTPACVGDCDPRLTDLDHWLPAAAPPYTAGDIPAAALASIVYTSGTTGKPKGVMLTHANILTNAYAGLQAVAIYSDDLFLSFLPLSHALERAVGYYLPIMAGACVAHVRSLDTLAEDLPAVAPTVLIAVPRIFERIHQRLTGKLAAAPAWKRRLFDLAVVAGWRRFEHRQGRSGWSPLLLLAPLLDHLVGPPLRKALGGRLRLAISGGAALNPAIAREFLALGVNILQGYGLTETSPVVSVNTTDDNRPETVGRPLPGVAVRLGEQNELLVRGANVMAGYWRNPAATAAVLDRDGWLHTGDQASLDAGGHITLTGRLKEIIVLANGEKVSPTDLELAITGDPLFEQAMVVGEGRPFLAALVVLNAAGWRRLAAALSVDPQDPAVLVDKRVAAVLLKRIGECLRSFPGYARVHRVHAGLEPWGVAGGLLTPTLKLRRAQVLERYAGAVDALYDGH